MIKYSLKPLLISFLLLSILSFKNTADKPLKKVAFTKEYQQKLNCKYLGKTEIDTLKYEEIETGRLIWMKKNLDVSTYNDGTPIPEVKDAEKWENLKTGAWCYYENKTESGIIYGKLYNWFAVAGIHDEESFTDFNKKKDLAPKGWNIPDDYEWKELEEFVKQNNLNLIESGEKGFAGLTGGYRTDYLATFLHKGSYGYWWTATNVDFENKYSVIRTMGLGGKLDMHVKDNRSGLSVRCFRYKPRPK